MKFICNSAPFIAKSIAAVMMSAINCFAAGLPDPALTPGAINPDVTQMNISRTVCVRGWTKTVRPPAFYTNRLKNLQIRQYGYADTNPRDYEYFPWSTWLAGRYA
jgi:hypothetical protein